MQNDKISPRDVYISIMAESIFGAAEAFCNQGYFIEAQEALQRARCLAPNQKRHADRLSVIIIERVNALMRAGDLSTAESILRRWIELGGDSPRSRGALIQVLFRQADQYAEKNQADMEDISLCKALFVGVDVPTTSALHSRIERLRGAHDYFQQGILSKELQFRTFYQMNKGSMAASQQLGWIIIDRAARLIDGGVYSDAESLLWEAFSICHDLRPQIVQHLVFILYRKAIQLFNGMRFSETELTAWEILELDSGHAPARQLLDICARHPARTVINIPDDRYTARSLEIRKALATKNIKDIDYVRIGRCEDGGYVMANHALNNKIVYSLGIGHDVSWDMDMAKLGCTVYQYDHTIDRLPEEHQNFVWSRTGIAGHPDESGVWSTLEQAIRKNGHQDVTDMILKIDIEGSEWSVLSEAPEAVLQQFTQIVGEYHGLTKIIDEEFYRGVISCLEKMNKHFVLAHVHVNNISTVRLLGGVIIFSEIEFLYIRNDVMEFTDSRRVFPNALDYPVRPEAADYRWNY